jgi:hypothetical protein
MKQDIHTLAAKCQTILRAKAIDWPDDWPEHVDRIYVDAWATLYRWHEAGERVWRISQAVADETEDMCLPSDLDLATARTRGEAVTYQLPVRSEWIVIARHAPAPCEVRVHGDVRWAYAQPVLTYCTMLADGSLAAGYYSLADMPTPDLLTLRPGATLGRSVRALTEASIAEEEYRVALALIHHYLP